MNVDLYEVIFFAQDQVGKIDNFGKITTCLTEDAAFKFLEINRKINKGNYYIRKYSCTPIVILKNKGESDAG